MKANITHTEWEKQYMYTLLSSPYAFEAFRYQQKNIKHFDQFTSRLIPCAKQIKQNYIITFNPLFKDKIIKNRIKYLLSTIIREYNCLNSKFNFIVFNIQFIVKRNCIDIDTCSIDLHLCSKSYVLSIYDKLDEKLHFQTQHIYMINGNETTNEIYAKNITEQYTKLSCTPNNKTNKHAIKIKYIKYANNIKEVIDIFETFLTDFINTYIQYDITTPFKIITHTNKYKKYQNIGIEFEYDYKGGIKWQDYKKYKDIISYDDNYDGNIPNRVNETRLRLNGNKGFIGLYDYLNYIKKYNINPVSIHIHIDCDYDNTFDRLYNLYSIKSLINAIHNNEYFCMTILRTIFFTNTKYQYSNVGIYDIIYNNIYLNVQHTMEYRFCYPTYNYTSIITQILVLSLITYAIKHKTKINIKLLDLIYVTYLKLISTK